MKKSALLSLTILSLTLFVLGTCSGAIMTFNTTINESGTYTFDEDLIIAQNYQSGILINASDVIIDGNNFKLTTNASEPGFGIYVGEGYNFTNIEIKNLNISNFERGIYICNANRVSVHNCEFHNISENIFAIDGAEFYAYLNKINKSERGSVRSGPIASPKVVYEYDGQEFTYRLGNYYDLNDSYKDDDNNGVIDSVISISRMHDPYPLKETPDNYVIKELYYPTVENLSRYEKPMIVDIFALTDEPKYYMGAVKPEPTPEPEPTPSKSSVGTIVKEEQQQGTKEGFGSQNIRDRVTLSNVIADDPLDAKLAREELKDNVLGYKDDMTLNEDAVVIGGPVSNAFANKYNDMFEKPISNDYPGENTGIIQVLKVQETSGSIVQTHYIIYIAGSDRFGTEAAVEYFKTLTELPEEPILVKWVDGKPVLVE